MAAQTAEVPDPHRLVVEARRRYCQPIDEMSQLLLEARAGDESAFAAFIRGSQPEVWRFCAYLIGRADADDATQETYLASWRALPSFRGESSARTWLLVIARRTALRVARRQLRLSELDRESPGPAQAPDPENWTELDSLIRELDEDRRLAILLTQILGLSYADAAEVSGCAVGTIRSRVARARADLLALRSGEDHGADLTRRPGPARARVSGAISQRDRTGT
ncbi:MAG: sigma-70 family RNA polymerase sigma factor [Acidimicrobiales bacterium]